MVFSSPIFAVFLVIVFAIYWGINNVNLRLQNLLILVSSYLFYGWWDWRFLSLIAISSVVDFVAAKRIFQTDDRRRKRIWLGVSLVLNLGMLGVFKYYNFFVSEFQEALSSFGFTGDSWTLSIILPVGISFYTFQTLSYTLDVYKGKMKPTDSLLQFAAYVSFFPQLVAGPIERASHLLPQFSVLRAFDYQRAMAGTRLIVWGLFKKIVIADSLAPIVNEIFQNYTELSGPTLALGSVLFAFQIYGDFSGYSDIAIGTARLLGFDLMSNFKFPYFARNIGEFWRRWHISLSSWFRDYLYIPLGGSKVNKATQIRNIFAIFLVSGLWHGANWTFIAWGGLHAILFLPAFLFGTNRKYTANDSSGYSIRDWFGVLTTFIFVCLGWIFFRAESITQAIDYIGGMTPSTSLNHLEYLLFPVVLVLLEWPIRNDEKLDELNLGKFELPILGFLLAAIIVFRDVATDFIYFQF